MRSQIEWYICCSFVDETLSHFLHWIHEYIGFSKSLTSRMEICRMRTSSLAEWNQEGLQGRISNPWWKYIKHYWMQWCVGIYSRFWSRSDWKSWNAQNWERTQFIKGSAVFCWIGLQWAATQMWRDGEVTGKPETTGGSRARRKTDLHDYRNRIDRERDGNVDGMKGSISQWCFHETLS